MCWICDHPGATERDYTDHMRQLITVYGWAVQGVERDGIHPPWAYTVGLTSHQRPELVITGMGLTRATSVLNGVAAHLLHADEPEPGTQAELRDGPLVEIVRVAVPWAHLNMAVELYGNRVRGLQLVHADKRGNWPWDRHYQGVRGGQPILGGREPPERRRRVGLAAHAGQLGAREGWSGLNRGSIVAEDCAGRLEPGMGAGGEGWGWASCRSRGTGTRQLGR